MTIGKTEKQEVIKKFGKDVKDTGSASVQVGIFSTRISELTEHLKVHKKDNHSRLGLIKLVSKRKKLLSYLKRTDVKQYGSITKDLKIRV